MFKNRIVLALGACSLLAFALPASAADPARVYAVVAQNGSGEAGTVTLTPVGEKTRVDVALVGAPAGIAQPAHLHLGPCAKLDPKPKYPLTTVMEGVSSTTLDMPMSTLTAGDLAVNVHKSTTEVAAYVACGDLTKKAVTGAATK
ncbi:MAG: hypothetical protein JWN27_1458 [Candidatus Eremiobacteraeota bacterium]|nr:hypothetical protein [Candidatus Eremiobacteraeota bacterium]